MSEEQTISVRCQLTVARLPLATEIDEFTFKDMLINEVLMRDRAGCTFNSQQRNDVIVADTVVDKTYPAMAHTCIRAGVHGRVLITLDLVNRLDVKPHGLEVRDGFLTT